MNSGQVRARSEVGLSRLPVTEEIAGSNPVGPAKHKYLKRPARVFCYDENMDYDDYKKLQELEESLWLPDTRFDHKYMDSILSPDFIEFGRSGHIYSRAESLAAHPQEIHIKLPLTNLHIHAIDDHIALITYISEVTCDTLEIANRSSLWLRSPEGWRLRFHQGTPAN